MCTASPANPCGGSWRMRKSKTCPSKQQSSSSAMALRLPANARSSGYRRRAWKRTWKPTPEKLKYEDFLPTFSLHKLLTVYQNRPAPHGSRDKTNRKIHNTMNTSNIDTALDPIQAKPFDTGDRVMLNSQLIITMPNRGRTYRFAPEDEFIVVRRKD